MTNKNGRMDSYGIEDLIRELGGYGRYQILMTVFIHAHKAVLVFSMYAMTFAGAVPRWLCSDATANSSVNQLDDKENETNRLKACSLNGTACSTYQFDYKVNTIVSEWKLVCDLKWAPATATTLQMTGVLIGNLVGGQIADSIGRKPTFYLGIACNVASNLLAFFSVSWEMFAAARFLIGIATGLVLTVQYNLACEFMLSKWRSAVLNIPSWEVFAAVYAGIAYFIRDWRYLHLITAILGFLFLPTWKLNSGYSFYAITFGVNNFSGDLFLNIFLVSIVELPAQLIPFILNNRFGRRKATMFCLVVSGSTALVVGIVQVIDTPLRAVLTNVCALISKIGASAMWVSVAALSMELYPTVVRTIGYGSPNAIARIGAMIAPQAVFLSIYFPGFMYFLVCLLMFFSLLLIMTLPETKNMALRDKMKDKFKTEMKDLKR